MNLLSDITEFQVLLKTIVALFDFYPFPDNFVEHLNFSTFYAITWLFCILLIPFSPIVGRIYEIYLVWSNL